MAARSAIPPRERDVIRAVIKALRGQGIADLEAVSQVYGVRRRLDNIAGRIDWSADLLDALIRDSR